MTYNVFGWTLNLAQLTQLTLLRIPVIVVRNDMQAVVKFHCDRILLFHWLIQAEA